MARRLPHYYFEASVYVAIIKREVVEGHERWWHCRGLVDDAAAGKAVAVTSALTITEVVRNPDATNKQPHENTVTQLKGFFENDHLILVDVDRTVAEHARELIWTLPLRQVDAVHLASALAAECDVLWTYDDDLLKCNGKVPGIRIERPLWTGAAQMGLLEGIATQAATTDPGGEPMR